MRACFALALAAALSASAQLSTPLAGDINVHDPVIIKAGGTYFIFHTGNGIAMKTSPDRKTWKNAARVFETQPAWHKQLVPKSGSSLWAPDISYRDGRYWLYYSVSSFGDRESAIGLATADTLLPTGTRWVDQGMVVRTTDADNYNAIDPNAYTDTDGSVWLAFGSWWKGIQLIRLDPATGKPAAGSALANIASRPKGIEAPFLIRRGGYYWLFVSFDKCCEGANSTYNIRVGRSTQVTGPYLDDKGAAMLAGGGKLIDSGDSRWKGPGHNAVLLEGDSSFLVNHAYDAQNAGTAKLQIRPLHWAQDGWPTLNNDGSAALARPFWKKPESARVPNSDLLGRRRPYIQPNSLGFSIFR